jgi:hypothetical protein
MGSPQVRSWSSPLTPENSGKLDHFQPSGFSTNPRRTGFDKKAHAISSKPCFFRMRVKELARRSNPLFQPCPAWQQFHRHKDKSVEQKRPAQARHGDNLRARATARKT